MVIWLEGLKPYSYRWLHCPITLPSLPRGIYGEHTYINSQHIELISEIVIFALIYGGVTKWSDTDAVVTVDIAGQPKVETRLYETSGVDNSLRVCAIARIRIDDDNISIERIEDYFIDHSYMDRYFGWGFNWKPGRK